MNGATFRGGILLILLLTLGGCVSAPVQEMSDARQAIRAAKAVGADALAPAKLSRAESFLDKAVIELESGTFQQARQDALSAWQWAVDARVSAVAARDAARIR